VTAAGPAAADRPASATFGSESRNPFREGISMTMFARAGVLFLAALLAACYPTTQTPIGSTGPKTPDVRLLGVWKGTPKDPKDGPNYLFFLPRKDKLEAVMVYPAKDDDKGGWMSFEVRTGKAGSNDFLNGIELLDDGEAPKDTSRDYTPVYYRFDKDGTLRLFVLGEDQIENAISKGEIKGEVKKNSFGDDVRITADAKIVDAFFATHDPKTLFTDPLGVYRRVK
jgi:hypothetical protein